DIVQMLREAGKLAKSITKKSATVGLSSAKKIILNSINTFSQAKIKAFDTVEEAKDWLAED
ncbi:MAG: hypothetical protein KAI79_05890, partial [Bacteroidales bacterium]|nr:hypothetical protein [Bacteroidales bacterium]